MSLYQNDNERRTVQPKLPKLYQPNRKDRAVRERQINSQRVEVAEQARPGSNLNLHENGKTLSGRLRPRRLV